MKEQLLKSEEAQVKEYFYTTVKLSLLTVPAAFALAFGLCTAFGIDKNAALASSATASAMAFFASGLTAFAIGCKRHKRTAGIQGNGYKGYLTFSQSS